MAVFAVMRMRVAHFVAGDDHRGNVMDFRFRVISVVTGSFGGMVGVMIVMMVVMRGVTVVMARVVGMVIVVMVVMGCMRCARFRRVCGERAVG